MAANYPGAGDRSTGMTSDSGQAGASCLSADCGGTPEGLEVPGGSLPDYLGGYCYTCRFWLAKVGQAVSGTVVAEMGDGSRHHFYFNPAEPIVRTGNPSLHLGFGGTPWRVSFLDGRAVETNDLYGQGEIPARFHHLFPPNATLEQLGYYDGRRIDHGPPFHLLALDFPAGLTGSQRPSMASGSDAARGYGRRRNALVRHLAGRHGLAGYDPFPLGTDHAYPTDPRGNVLVQNHDLGELLWLHDREGTHGRSTHQHDSRAGQELLGQYVSPQAWQLSPDQRARAAAALDAWFGHGPTGSRAPGQARMTWDQRELEGMHAALEAPTIDAALEAFPGGPGSLLSTPEQDAWNRQTMTELRKALPAATSSSQPAVALSTQRSRPRRTAGATPQSPRSPRP
jgi:hypothetical protein